MGCYLVVGGIPRGIPQSWGALSLFFVILGLGAGDPQVPTGRGSRPGPVGWVEMRDSWGASWWSAWWVRLLFRGHVRQSANTRRRASEGRGQPQDDPGMAQNGPRI